MGALATIGRLADFGVNTFEIGSTISRTREAICDTLPIQYLHQIGFLHLPQEFYTRTLIRPAVAGELKRGRANARRSPDTGWRMKSYASDSMDRRCLTYQLHPFRA